MSIVCPVKAVAQSVTVETKIDSLADTDWRTGESAITSSDGCQTACCFSCLYRYTGKRGRNYRNRQTGYTIPE